MADVAAARVLALITDDIAYLAAAARQFGGFLLDTTLSRRNFGRRNGDLLAIQTYVPAADAMNADLLAYFFNSAQREVVKILRPAVTQSDLDIYFPAPPGLVANAQDILRLLDQPLLLRALASRQGFGADSGGGRGRRRGRRFRGPRGKSPRGPEFGARRSPSRSGSQSSRRR
jgi:hypothetical protein